MFVGFVRQLVSHNVSRPAFWPDPAFTVTISAPCVPTPSPQRMTISSVVSCSHRANSCSASALGDAGVDVPNQSWDALYRQYQRLGWSDSQKIEIQELFKTVPLRFQCPFLQQVDTALEIDIVHLVTLPVVNRNGFTTQVR